MIDWKSKFDHIYCIHFLPKHNDRFSRIEQELSRVGILSSGVFSWKFTFDNPFFRKLHDNVEVRHPVMRSHQGMFNCAIAHYEVYKEAIELKYRRILVLEEDIMFLRNVDLLEQIVDDMPDTDVVLFDKFVYFPLEFQRDLSKPEDRINVYFQRFDTKSTKYGSAACYSLSEKAFRAFAAQQEKLMYNPDELWNDWGDNLECNQLSKSFAILNAGYQKSFPGSNNDNIELAYKFVNLNKELYE